VRYFAGLYAFQELYEPISFLVPVLCAHMSLRASPDKHMGSVGISLILAIIRPLRAVVCPEPREDLVVISDVLD